MLIRDWVHGMGHSPVCHILLQILWKALVTASPPARTAPPRHCVSLEIFPSWAISQLLPPLPARLGNYQCRLLVGQSAPQGHPRLWMYSSAQYSVRLFRMSLVSVRQFPSLSCMVLVFPCFVLVRVFTNWYAFLLLFFLMLSSMSWHCTSTQESFTFFLCSS